MAKFAALCAEGAESIILKEIEEKAVGYSNVSVQKGIVFFEYSGDYSRLISLKCPDDVLVFVKKLSGITRYRSSLKNIRHQSAKANFSNALFVCRKIRKAVPIISASVSYKGRRDYTAKEAEKEIILGVRKHYGWQQGNKPDMILHAILSGEISFLGAGLERVPFHSREGLIKSAGSLKDSLAYTLLNLAGVKRGIILADPMCGTGTIPVCAALLGADAIGGDIEEERLEIAKKNAEMKNARIRLYRWDARSTTLKDSEADAIVTNLPFGKQLPVSGEHDFFESAIKEISRIAKKGARIILLTKHGKIIRKLSGISGIIEKGAIDIKISGLPSEIIIFEKS